MLNGNGSVDTSTHRLVAVIVPREANAQAAEPPTEELRAEPPTTETELPRLDP